MGNNVLITWDLVILSSQNISMIHLSIKHLETTLESTHFEALEPKLESLHFMLVLATLVALVLATLVALVAAIVSTSHGIIIHPVAAIPPVCCCCGYHSVHLPWHYYTSRG